MSVDPSKTQCQPNDSVKQDWIRQQNELKKSLITNNQVSWLPANNNDNNVSLHGLHYIGGIDQSYSKSNPFYACASLVVLKFPEMELVYSNYSGIVHVNQPYIPGFLAFREFEHLSYCINKLRQEQPSLLPQVILVDGNGILHHQEFGSACHLGVLADIPTIGVAKNLLEVHGIARDSKHMDQIAQLSTKGDSFPLTNRSGVILGMALRSSEQSTRPIYVSVGHRLDLKTATKIVLASCKYRLPEPIRQADHLSREYLRINLSELGNQEIK
ncbi:uncharacterized protein TRIADDRAFT_53685 [Trichoplax adhaerens]|uniref:Endonuclease V n=1 Tax=Trichoplax adhaerens TaxID=10228 RepID=B3RPW3_TRIAD|nr:hypothetical protein TRIADDRAFT_53685 [Trichoplax adhaerens]EDV28252.1 hypothetical protein TRIADDRAFT_53685 [Trichoplax adhaerens]|eukprot:XP_002110086.1 hypothetical protein TRIADDRAFT_53685 [Trichoplax adhaerens]